MFSLCKGPCNKRCCESLTTSGLGVGSEFRVHRCQADAVAGAGRRLSVEHGRGVGRAERRTASKFLHSRVRAPQHGP